MKAPSCRVCDMGVYRGLYGRSWFFFLCRKDPGGNTAPSKYFEKLMQYALRDDFSRLTFCILSKGIFFGGGGGFAIKGRRILMIREWLSWTFEEYQPSWKSRGPHGKLFWDYCSLANCELVFHVSFRNHYSDIDGTGSLGFILFYFFLIPQASIFLSVLPLPPHLLLCPSHSLQTPPPSSPLPSVHPSSPRSSVDCRGRNWTVKLTPD